MTDIRYLSPHTLDEAVSAFAAAGSAARILAGGTDLLVQMRAGVVKPGLIVDIKNIAEMTAIEATADGGFRVGAAVSGMELAVLSGCKTGLGKEAAGEGKVGQGRASLARKPQPSRSRTGMYWLTRSRLSRTLTSAKWPCFASIRARSGAIACFISATGASHSGSCI